MVLFDPEGSNLNLNVCLHDAPAFTLLPTDILLRNALLPLKEMIICPWPSAGHDERIDSCRCGSEISFPNPYLSCLRYTELHRLGHRRLQSPPLHQHLLRRHTEPHLVCLLPVSVGFLGHLEISSVCSASIALSSLHLT